MGLLTALQPVTIGGSSSTPPASGTGTDPGAYNAFPAVAAHTDGSLLALWQHAKDHAGGGNGFVQGAFRSVAGVWGAPFTVWDDPSPTAAVGGISLTFMPARGSFPARWCLIGQAVTFSSSTSTTVTSRTSKVRTSADGVSWADVGGNPFAGDWYDGGGLPLAAPNWVFPSDILWVDDGTDAGCLFACAYASFPGERQGPLVVVSLNRGASWKHVNWGPDTALDRGSVPATANLVEPQLLADTAAPGSVIHVYLREDTSSTMWTLALTDWSAAWGSTLRWAVSVVSPATAVITGVSGLPVVHRDASGGLHAFLRTTARSFGDATHYPWAWFTSTDGVSWLNQGDFTGTGRAAMYAAAANLPDGSFVLVHASEDGARWGPASVYSSTFTQIQCSAVVRYDGVPRVEVRTSIPSPVFRVWTDAAGNSRRDQVRINAGNSTMWIDYEVLPGVPVTYDTRSGTTDPVRIRGGEGLWLIHPVRPALSMQVTVREQGDVGNDLDLNEVSVMGRANPVTVGAAVRGGDKFTLTVRTETDDDARGLARLLKDGAPLFLAGRQSYMFPEWVRVGSITQNRLWQWDGEQRRVWELPCTEIDRPTAVDLPSIYRIRDLNLPIRYLTGKIRDGLMPR